MTQGVGLLFLPTRQGTTEIAVWVRCLARNQPNRPRNIFEFPEATNQIQQ